MISRVGRARYFAWRLCLNWERLWGNSTCSGYVLQNVLDMAERLEDKAAVGREEIRERLAQFVQHWEKLKELTKAR